MSYEYMCYVCGAGFQTFDNHDAKFCPICGERQIYKRFDIINHYAVSIEDLKATFEHFKIPFTKENIDILINTDIETIICEEILTIGEDIIRDVIKENIELFNMKSSDKTSS